MGQTLLCREERSGHARSISVRHYPVTFHGKEYSTVRNHHVAASR